MRILYFDCFSGISGDMTLGALLDLGADKDKLIKELKLLNIDGYEIKTEKKLKNGIMGTAFEVVLQEEGEHKDVEQHHICNDEHVHDENFHSHEGLHQHEHSLKEHEHTHRSYRDIVDLIDNSGLNENVKEMSKKMFNIIAEAEGKIHGKPADEVHFHEVGAIDSIIDIIGTAICIDMLRVDKIVFSKIPLPSGFVKCQHGVFPLPAPATIEILKDVPVYFSDANFELVTPTGAAIVKGLGEEFGSFEDLSIEKVGYGVGKKTYEIPNVLRCVIFNAKKNINNFIYKLEANIDDMTPETLGFVMDKLLSAGALDVYFTHIVMKKNRPGIMLGVLCSPESKERLSNIILRETSTFGIRYVKMNRDILDRESCEIEICGEKVRCKLGTLEGKTIKYAPEYEDCKKVAEKTGIPIVEVFNKAVVKISEVLN